jgi:hypothetical protein
MFVPEALKLFAMWWMALFCNVSLAMPEHRHLEDPASDYDADTTFFQYDLSSFSLKFEKCQSIKSFNDDYASQNGYDTVLSKQQFVVFSLCPSDICIAESSSTRNNNNYIYKSRQSMCSKGIHGEYVTELETYLSATVAYQQTVFASLCENCNEYCDGNTCSGCGKTCYEYSTLSSNGYVDASQYTTCTKINYQQNNNGEGQNNNNNYVYVGPSCSSDGKSIVIGVFSDQYCSQGIDDLNIESVLGYHLYYRILNMAIASEDGNDSCLTCLEDSSYYNSKDQEDADQVNEMCEEIYNKAAKCETPHGLENGLIYANRNNKDNKNDDKNNAENQAENEFMSCTFIHSLLWNSYTETGEINYMAVQDEILREVTLKQAVALACLSFAFVGMLLYGAILNCRIAKYETSPSTIELTSQGEGVFT